MPSTNSSHEEFDQTEPIIPLPWVLMILFATFVGTLGAVTALQAWLPGLTYSLFGPQPKAYWDLARVGGIVAYLLVWMSTMFGLLITNRFARVWPGGPTGMDLHQFTGLLGFVFAVFHVLVLMGDQFIQYTLPQLLIPFGSVGYQQLWVGLGQISFYVLIPVTFTFYARKQLGYNMWRAIHYGSFIVFALITVHGLLAGSDTTNPGVMLMYALTGASVYFLTIYRIIMMFRSVPQSGH